MSQSTTFVRVSPISATEISVLVATEYAKSLHEYLRGVGVTVSPNEAAIFRPYSFVTKDRKIVRYEEPLDFYFEAECSQEDMARHLSDWCTKNVRAA